VPCEELDVRPSEFLHRSVVATSDVDEAHQQITKVYNEHSLSARDGQALDFKLRYLSSDRLTLGKLRYGVDAELKAPPLDSAYHLNLPIRGASVASQAGDSATSEAGKRGVLLNPSAPFSVRWRSDAVQYAIRVPRAALEGELAALIGRPVTAPIKFALGFDMTSPSGEGLLAAVRHLRKEMSRDHGIAEFPLVRAQLESYVLSRILLAIPHEFHHLLSGTVDPIRRRHIREAINFMEEHAAEPITAADIARAACVGMRALQSGFRAELNMTPMSYLRHLRLDRARADLLASSGEVSVSRVASRWGFTHLGRFAEQYKMKFGELPSEAARGKSEDR
jgi:AraC-like DNA-binding protein